MPSSVSQTGYVAPLDAREVSELLTRIYGRDPGGDLGVIHSAAAVRAEGGRLHVLSIGPHAPKSQTDFFLLQAIRARADVIITSSANLRAEPQLHHDFQGPAAKGLLDYRRTRLAKSKPPELYILTQSGDLPAGHLTFRDSTRKHVLTPSNAAEGVRALGLSGVTVQEVDEVSVRSAVRLARQHGHHTISIETGPRLSSACYGGERLVNELCLAIYLGGPLSPEAIGGALPEDASLFAGLTATGPGFEAEHFLFQRYL